MIPLNKKHGAISVLHRCRTKTKPVYWASGYARRIINSRNHRLKEVSDCGDVADIVRADTDWNGLTRIPSATESIACLLNEERYSTGPVSYSARVTSLRERCVCINGKTDAIIVLKGIPTFGDVAYVRRSRAILPCSCYRNAIVSVDNTIARPRSHAERNRRLLRIVNAWAVARTQ